MPRLLAAILACMALTAVAIPSSAPAYVLDSGTGRFTNPPVGGLGVKVRIAGDASTIPHIREVWAAAVRFWGGVPRSCRTKGVRLRLSRDDPDADPDDTETSAWVYDEEPCSMYFNEANDDWPVADDLFGWCSVVTHEMGHMLGLSHSSSRHNIMTGDWIPDANPECNRFATEEDDPAVAQVGDPFYDAHGRRRSAAQRVAYLRRRSLRR